MWWLPHLGGNECKAHLMARSNLLEEIHRMPITAPPPEKNYYSVQEITDRWQCSTETIIHYVEEIMLRPAIDVNDILDEHALFDLEGAAKELPGEADINLGDLLVPNKALGEVLDRNLFDRNHRFVYINADYIFASMADPPYIYGLEEFSGKLLGLANPYSRKTRPYTPTTLLQWRLGTSYEWNPSEIIITREERDRFEREHNMIEPREPATMTYRTEYIDVMHAAISEFFEPRRTRDPKKNEVVSWINERLIERGLGKSENTASTMFTIIKPADHNPRKEKG